MFNCTAGAAATSANKSLETQLDRMHTSAWPKCGKVQQFKQDATGQEVGKTKSAGVR